MRPATIQIETSVCPQTGLGGWGASIHSHRGDLVTSGQIEEAEGTTHADFRAAEQGLLSAIAKSLVGAGDHVVLAMKARAALGVLLWVFPEARYRGPHPPERPRRIQKSVADCQALADLHDLVERYGLVLELDMSHSTRSTEQAKKLAREVLVQARATQ